MLGACRLVAWPNSWNSSARLAITTILHHGRSGGLHPPYELKKAVWPRRRTGEKGRKSPHFSRSFPFAEAAIEKRQSQGTLAFMATRTSVWRPEGVFSTGRGRKKAKGKSKKAKVCGRAWLDQVSR